MTRLWWLSVVGFALPATLLAHPHAQVDQQAQLSLSRTQAIITYRIVPSSSDGAHMFEHLDRNRNGSVSAAERQAFATALLARTTFTLNGLPVRLAVTEISIPRRSTMASGQGLINVAAQAQLPLSRDQTHRIAFDVRYLDFAPRWFIQPYYDRALSTERAQPQLTRPSGTTSVHITIPRS